MASKKTSLQGNNKGSASAPATATTSPIEDTIYVFKIVWEKSLAYKWGWEYGPPLSEFEAFVRIEGKSTDGSTMVNCVASLRWRDSDEIEFSCIYNTETEMFSDFQWINKALFGGDPHESNGLIKDVSISMKGKSYNETEDAADREVLDDAGNRFLFVVFAFEKEDEAGMSYAKLVVDGAFKDCVLTDEEKKRLRLD